MVLVAAAFFYASAIVFFPLIGFSGFVQQVAILAQNGFATFAFYGVDADAETNGAGEGFEVWKRATVHVFAELDGGF